MREVDLRSYIEQEDNIQNGDIKDLNPKENMFRVASHALEGTAIEINNSGFTMGEDA